MRAEALSWSFSQKEPSRGDLQTEADAKPPARAQAALTCRPTGQWKEPAGLCTASPGWTRQPQRGSSVPG